METGENSKHLIVNMSVPKFDVVSDFDLGDGLRALGVTDVFDVTVADFSPMTSEVAEIFLSKADHAARVAIDEEGVTAAAYTVMMMAGLQRPPEEKWILYWTVRSCLPSLAMMDCHCSLA